MPAISVLVLGEISLFLRRRERHGARMLTGVLAGHWIQQEAATGHGRGAESGRLGRGRRMARTMSYCVRAPTADPADGGSDDSPDSL
jgi:hypothetical protein